MTQLDVVTFQYKEFPVTFQTDGYLNATAVAKPFGKKVESYLKKSRTKEYISELSDALFGTPTAAELVRKGDYLDEQEIWLHPKLAVDFARWLSPEFSLWCYDRAEEFLNKDRVQSQHRLPTNFLEALEAIVESEQVKEDALLKKAKADEEIARLTAFIDKAYMYTSIQRATDFLGIEETEFNWRTLKVITLGIGLPIKGVSLTRRGDQYLFPIRAFQIAYSDYDFDDLESELREEKLVKTPQHSSSRELKFY
jgi:hypothetical protein